MVFGKNSTKYIPAREDLSKIIRKIIKNSRSVKFLTKLQVFLLKLPYGNILVRK